VQDFDEESLAALIGIARSIKSRETTIAEAFPPPAGERPAAPAATKSKGAALDDLVDAAKGKSTPPPANDAGPLEPATVHAALAHVDDAWVPDTGLAIIAQWSPAERQIAYDWALAFAATPNDVEPPEQPEFTLLAREPGSDG
jgi:hypothetical protein